MRTPLALTLIATLSLVAATVVLVPTASAECTGDSCIALCDYVTNSTCVVAGSQGGDCSSAALNYAAIYHDSFPLAGTGLIGAYAFTSCEGDPSPDRRIAVSVYDCYETTCRHVSWGWAQDGSGCQSRVDIALAGVDALLNPPLCQVASPPAVPRILP